ncbi:MAG: DNA-directed RNA polymerase subunit omega [Armatimonadetes bacterium]|nr:DNA-directed RNA polymerase subunit omega [Armatimonadota bacterium]
MFPQPDILNEFEFGRFVLTNLAAKRAKQIKEGAPPLVRIDSSHPLSIALAEIAQGKIKPLFGKEAEAVEEAKAEALADAGSSGLLLPSLDDETLIQLTVDEGSAQVAATSTSLLASLLGAGEAVAEETEKPDGEVAMDISLEELASQEEKKAASEGEQ